MNATRIVTLFAFALLGESQTERTSQPAANTETPQTVASCPISDPFCARLNESNKAEHEHDRLQADIESRLGGMQSCSQAVYDEITSVRMASDRAHGAYLDYLDDWRKLAANDKALFQRLTQSRSGLRAEIDKRIKDLGTELTELDQRASTLQTTLAQAGAEPAGRDMNALGTLKTSKRERMTNLQHTADKWAQTQRYYDGSLEHAKRLEMTLAELTLLVRSGNDLWKAYYESLEARAQYNCVSERDPVRTKLGTKRPPA